MSRAIINIADVELEPFPTAFAPTGATHNHRVSEEMFVILDEFADANGKPQVFRFVGRRERGADYWEGE